MSMSRCDPSSRWWSGGFARAVHTPDGPGVLRLTWSTANGDVTADAWGSGASWLLDAAPHWLGAADRVEDFHPSSHPKLDAMWRRAQRPRLGRSGLVWSELAFAVVGQRVTGLDAMRSWRAMVAAWGTPAPGPLGLRLAPTPAMLADRSYVELHRFGIERRRADALVAVARRADRLETAATMSVADAVDRLTSVPGIGEWTATSTVTVSHGDPDTVILGDYGIPTLVSYAFTGSGKRVGDERMLELLAPFNGHRWRVVRLLSTAGVRAPRRAPRARNPRIQRL